MSLKNVIAIIALIPLFACGLEGSMQGGASLAVNEGEGGGDVSEGVEQFEGRTYERVPSGGGIVRVTPQVYSYDDLMAYRELKIAEAVEILAITKEGSAEKPYYPAIITMARPLSLAELNEMIAGYNPSVGKRLLQPGVSVSKHLVKAPLIKGKDKLVIHSATFVSTSGGGRLSYDTLSDAEQLKVLEEGVGEEGFQLVAGITSIVGGVHREEVIVLGDDPRVFLADIGPIELYRGEVEGALWSDVAGPLGEYVNQ